MSEPTNERFTLCGRLPEIAQLHSWVERMVSKYRISANVQFSIELCLEEVVSNIILHGYGGETDRPVTVFLTELRPGYFVFTVEDEAPVFNPLEAPELPALNPHEEIRVGGQGIRFLRQFASTIEYEAKPGGNRLKIGFNDELP